MLKVVCDKSTINEVHHKKSNAYNLDGAFFYRVTETPDPCHIPINPGALPKSQKTSDLTLNMFVKSSDHENGGQLISELIAREGFTRLEDSGTLLKARAFDGKGKDNHSNNFIFIKTLTWVTCSCFFWHLSAF